MTTISRPVVGALLAVLFALTLGWSQPAATRGAAQQPAAGPKLLWHVFRSPGDRNGKDHGLITAGWDDGLVIFATNLRDPGSSLHAGQISTQQIAHVMSELKATGFFDDQPGARGYPPDAAYTHFAATLDGKHVVYRYTGHLVPGHDVNVDSKPEFIKFAKMWTLANTVILFSAPTDFLPLEKQAGAKARYDQFKARNEIGR